jgi:hypothetical protein
MKFLRALVDRKTLWSRGQEFKPFNHDPLAPTPKDLGQEGWGRRRQVNTKKRMYTKEKQDFCGVALPPACRLPPSGG